MITKLKEIGCITLKRNVAYFGQTEGTLFTLLHMKSLIISDNYDPRVNSILRGDINLSQLNITTLQKNMLLHYNEKIENHLHSSRIF